MFGSNKKRRRAPVSDRAFLRRVFSVYFAVHILFGGAFLLFAGADLARRGSEKVLGNEAETCITVEDLNKWRQNAEQWLFHLYKNSGAARFFEKND